MSKVARGRSDRRHTRHVGVPMPGKKVGRSIDAIMRQPTLRRSDPASWVTLAGVSSQDANTSSRRTRYVLSQGKPALAPAASLDVNS